MRYTVLCALALALPHRVCATVHADLQGKTASALRTQVQAGETLGAGQVEQTSPDDLAGLWISPHSYYRNLLASQSRVKR